MADNGSATLLSDLRAAAEQLRPDLIELRRAVHAEPELGLQLPRTQARVLDALRGRDLEVHTGSALTSVVAVLRGAHPGPTVLLRADMDALPIAELADVPYASAGAAMHACGHDMHTAGLVGAARLLAQHRDRLHGNVLLMFQPGEEGYAGARLMLEEGLLERAPTQVVAAFAIHVGPGPAGVFLTRPGVATAGSSRFAITVRGSGGHASRPHEARDPVPAAAEIILAIQSFAARRFDSFDPVVISVTQLSAASNADNVIADEVQLSGTIRTMSPEALARVEDELPRLVQGIASGHGLSAVCPIVTQYPCVVNDPALTGAAVDVLRTAFGPRVAVAPHPTMGAEDFSFLAQRVPSTMLMLLAGPPDRAGEPAPNHSPHAVFDDAVLVDQAVALALLAIQTLAAHHEDAA